MAPAVPAVEVADHADAFGVRRPDGETYTGNTVDLVQMGSQHAVEMPVPAGREQAEVEVRDQRRKAVGIVDEVFMVGAVAPAEAVAVGYGAGCAAPFEQVGALDALEGEVALDDGDLAGIGYECTDQVLARLRAMFAEHRERVVMPCLDDPLQLCGTCCCHCTASSRYAVSTRVTGADAGSAWATLMSAASQLCK